MTSCRGDSATGGRDTTGRARLAWQITRIMPMATAPLIVVMRFSRSRASTRDDAISELPAQELLRILILLATVLKG